MGDIGSSTSKRSEALAVPGGRVTVCLGDQRRRTGQK